MKITEVETILLEIPSDGGRLPGPGLGADPDPDVIDRHRIHTRARP